ncbi:MAG: YvrJ family protein [Synergistaceae bacterium]|nr:YvrJ family protein [Synergistaceae bacterium]
MDELIATMMQSGFSVAVAAYLLVRMERRLEELTLAIRGLHAAISGSTTRAEP